MHEQATPEAQEYRGAHDIMKVMAIEYEKVRTLLEQEFARIELELTDIGYLHVHNGAGFVGAPKDIVAEPEDMNEMGDFDGMQETNKAIAVELLQKQADVTHALAKLTEGSYGICITCKKEIEPRRLAAYLAARTCMDCA
ncbi:MAG: hypothetical protein RI911_908 [Candidatus Parcubacteria bacterium]|jgi:hypothetical protein